MSMIAKSCVRKHQEKACRPVHRFLQRWTDQSACTCRVRLASTLTPVRTAKVSGIAEFTVEGSLARSAVQSTIRWTADRKRVPLGNRASGLVGVPHGTRSPWSASRGAPSSGAELFLSSLPSPGAIPPGYRPKEWSRATPTKKLVRRGVPPNTQASRRRPRSISTLWDMHPPLFPEGGFLPPVFPPSKSLDRRTLYRSSVLPPRLHCAAPAKRSSSCSGAVSSMSRKQSKHVQKAQ